MNHSTPITKVGGMNPKIRGYLRALHPELGNRIRVGQVLEKYPKMENFLEAVNGHVGGGVNPRSLRSIKSNITRAYALMMSESGGSSIKRKAVGQPDTQPADKVQKLTASEATPADLVRPLLVNETREAPILEQLANERDMNKPFGAGKETPVTGEGVSNTQEPVPSWAMRSQNFPNVSAESTEKALDMAESDPIRPTKELTVLPTFVDNALLTQQEEYYLEHRNTNSLAQASFSTPAAALTTNYGDGVREGIRRRDTDVEMEEEKQELRLTENPTTNEEKKGGGGHAWQSVMGRAKPFADKFVPQQTKANSLAQGIQMLSGGIESLSGQVSSYIQASYIRDQAQILHSKRQEFMRLYPNTDPKDLEEIYPTGGFLSQIGSGVQNSVVRQAADAAGGLLKSTAAVVGEVAEHADILKRKSSRKVTDQQMSAFIEQLQSEKSDGPARPVQEVDQLRPFMPMAGSSDVELRPGENEQKMRNEALFNDYKPANWPLGNMDNALYLQNLVLQGIRWESPLDNIPPVLPGGSLLQGAQEFTSEIPLPDLSTLQLIAMEKQMEFKIPKSGKRVIMHSVQSLAESMRQTVTQDVLWSFAPTGGGGNNPQVFNKDELNPLHTPLYPVLRLGGSEPLRNLYGPSDAFAMDSQIGQEEAPAPLQSYAFGPRYNLHAARFGYH